jgi:CSLREA domain-containing protein
MATFTVTTAADLVSAVDGKLSLREAINQANGTSAPDTILFAPGLEGKTLTLTGGELILRQDVTIDGDQDNNGIEVTLSSGDVQRILRTSGAGTDVALHDLTLEHGAPSAGRGGAIFVGGGGLSLDGSTIQNNHNSYEVNYDPHGQGGGIFAEAGSKIIISDSIVKGNYAGGDGGGIYAENGSILKLSNSLVI